MSSTKPIEKDSFTAEGAQFAWDSTSLSLAQACPRKYYYSMIRGIKPKQESVHLIFGGIYASCLEGFYKRTFAGMDYEEALRETVLQALTLSWDEAAGRPILFDDDKKTRAALIRSIIWYFEYFVKDREDALPPVRLQDGAPAVELSFNFELADGINYCGHLDRVAESGGKFYVVDQKTTGGSIGPYYARYFSPDNQMSGYSYAGRVVLQSPIAGVIVDAAQVGVNFTRFERFPVLRSQSQLEEWRESTLFTIRSTISMTLLNQFPMNTTACGNYGGCPFREICAMPPRLRESAIKTDFVEHHWDPLKER